MCAIAAGSLSRLSNKSNLYHRMIASKKLRPEHFAVVAHTNDAGGRLHFRKRASNVLHTAYKITEEHTATGTGKEADFSATLL